MTSSIPSRSNQVEVPVAVPVHQVPPDELEVVSVDRVEEKAQQVGNNILAVPSPSAPPTSLLSQGSFIMEIVKDGAIRYTGVNQKIGRMKFKDLSAFVKDSLAGNSNISLERKRNILQEYEVAVNNLSQKKLSLISRLFFGEYFKNRGVANARSVIQKVRLEIDNEEEREQLRVKAKAAVDQHIKPALKSFLDASERATGAIEKTKQEFSQFYNSALSNYAERVKGAKIVSQVDLKDQVDLEEKVKPFEKEWLQLKADITSLDHFKSEFLRIVGDENNAGCSEAVRLSSKSNLFLSDYIEENVPSLAPKDGKPSHNSIDSISFQYLFEKHKFKLEKEVLQIVDQSAKLVLDCYAQYTATKDRFWMDAAKEAYSKYDNLADLFLAKNDKGRRILKGFGSKDIDLLNIINKACRGEESK